MTAVATIVRTEFPELELHCLTSGVTVLVETDITYYPRPYMTMHPAFIQGEAAAKALSYAALKREYARFSDYSEPFDNSPGAQGYRFAVRHRYLCMMDAARKAMAAY